VAGFVAAGSKGKKEEGRGVEASLVKSLSKSLG